MNKRTRNSLILLIALVGLTLWIEPSLANKLPEPQLSVEFPDIKFTGTTDGSTVTTNWLGEYVAGIYRWLIGSMTIVAIVFVMISGLMYAFGASSQNAISKAKERIRNAVIGLVLLLGAHIMLVTVNPSLVIFRDFEIDTIDYVSLVQDSGDWTGSIDTSQLEQAGIDCPGSGDVKQIAQSFEGNATYRFGAKGNPQPYESESKTAPDGTPYATFCPEGTVCLDCSGYVALVAHCAGLADVNETGGTAGIFASAPQITECGDDWVATDTESIELEAGDLVGFKNGDIEGMSGGHVWMYIGEGKLINAVGRGRASGTAIQTQSLTSACNRFNLRVVDRNP